MVLRSSSEAALLSCTLRSTVRRAPFSSLVMRDRLYSSELLSPLPILTLMPRLPCAISFITSAA
ncbi:hypothetical protein D3C72_2427430 [compost metagenome]